MENRLHIFPGDIQEEIFYHHGRARGQMTLHHYYRYYHKSILVKNIVQYWENVADIRLTDFSLPGFFSRLLWNVPIKDLQNFLYLRTEMTAREAAAEESRRRDVVATALAAANARRSAAQWLIEANTLVPPEEPGSIRSISARRRAVNKRFIARAKWDEFNTRWIKYWKFIERIKAEIEMSDRGHCSIM